MPICKGRNPALGKGMTIARLIVRSRRRRSNPDQLYNWIATLPVVARNDESLSKTSHQHIREYSHTQGVLHKKLKITPAMAVGIS